MGTIEFGRFERRSVPIPVSRWSEVNHNREKVTEGRLIRQAFFELLGKSAQNSVN
jgi:hypothetical protein